MSRCGAEHAVSQLPAVDLAGVVEHVVSEMGPDLLHDIVFAQHVPDDVVGIDNVRAVRRKPLRDG